MRRSVADPGEEEEIEGGQDFQKIHFKNGKHLSIDFKKVELFVSHGESCSKLGGEYDGTGVVPLPENLS